MRVKSVAWALTNNAQWTLAQHLNRLCKLFLRNCPDEFVIQKVHCSMRDGSVLAYDVNRRLDHDIRKEMKRFLKSNHKDVVFFQVQFINFQYRENIKMSLTGIEPFDQLDLIGDNVPSWLHEMVNRKFQSEIGVTHKLWSYFYNHRVFRHSLGR